MTMELVTGHAGAAHVSGADVGAFNAGTIGSGTYILASSLPVLSMLDANTLEVPVCEILAEGRHVRITAAENVTIESGSQAGYRNDIVYLRYNLDSGTGEETATLVVAKGTTVANQSDVVDPTTAYSSASILDGASTVDIELIRVSLAGLTPTPEWVVGSQGTLETAFATMPRIYTGYLSPNVGSSVVKYQLWSTSSFESAFNTSAAYRCGVILTNGDSYAHDLGPLCSEYRNSGGNTGWYARWSNSRSGVTTFRYVVIVPAEYSTV